MVRDRIRGTHVVSTHSWLRASQTLGVSGSLNANEATQRMGGLWGGWSPEAGMLSLPLRRRERSWPAG